jgi:hypothetical protein
MEDEVSQAAVTRARGDWVYLDKFSRPSVCAGFGTHVGDGKDTHSGGPVAKEISTQGVWCLISMQ